MAIMGNYTDEIKMFRRVNHTGKAYWWHCPAFETMTDKKGEKHFMVRHEPTEKCNIYLLPNGWFIGSDNAVYMDESTSISPTHIDEDEDGNLYFKTEDGWQYLTLLEEDVPIAFEEFE